MFNQIYFSPQVKWCAIITSKHDKYEFPHKLPNELREKSTLEYYTINQRDQENVTGITTLTKKTLYSQQCSFQQWFQMRLLNEHLQNLERYIGLFMGDKRRISSSNLSVMGRDMPVWHHMDPSKVSPTRSNSTGKTDPSMLCGLRR